MSIRIRDDTKNCNTLMDSWGAGRNRDVIRKRGYVGLGAPKTHFTWVRSTVDEKELLREKHDARTGMLGSLLPSKPLGLSLHGKSKLTERYNDQREAVHSLSKRGNKG